jgi:hypothetical protein
MKGCILSSPYSLMARSCANGHHHSQHGGLTMAIANIKWGLIAAAIWASINQIAIIVYNTPLF